MEHDVLCQEVKRDNTNTEQRALLILNAVPTCFIGLFCLRGGGGESLNYSPYSLLYHL